jgi:rhodanese-related sulfurtransferase
MVNTLRPYVTCTILKIFGIIVLGCFLGCFSGCDSGISDKNITYIMPRDAAVMMREGKSTLLGPRAATVLVDPRPSWSYLKSHIPGSINIPFGRLYLQSWQLDHAGVIIVSGETYNDSVSIAMSKALMQLGFTDVKTLRGGLVGWDDAGEVVETAE